MQKRMQPNPQTICWVPTCENKYGFKRKFRSLTTASSKLRETWLALASKPKEGITDDKIFFCSDHFKPNDVVFTIDNVMYSQQQNVVVPNYNMPDRVCRTCNNFMNTKDPMYTISTCFVSEVPKTLQAELKNGMLSTNPEPLHNVFRFCFTDFILPADPIPIICNKCYENIWLVFTFKKRANEIEERIAENFTPEEYGKMVLCRTCTIERSSNFFNIDKHSDLGNLLQNMFQRRYSPDVVPLRVCTNCNGILEKINSFYKDCIVTEKFIKLREILSAELKVNNISPTVPVTTIKLEKEDVIKRENLILANLMLSHGQTLISNIHNIENWKPICEKLKQQGINHNVPSLINNWKKLHSITMDKLQKNIPLSEIETLVLKFDQISKKNTLPTTSQLLNRFQQGDTADNDHSLGCQTRRSVIRCFPSTSNAIEDCEETNENACTTLEIEQKPISKKEKLDTVRIKTQYKKDGNTSIERKKPGRKKGWKTNADPNSGTISFDEKMILVKAMQAEFELTTPEERRSISLWKNLVQRIHTKHLSHIGYNRLLNLWNRLKKSASIHEKDGSDIFDVEIWKILKQLNEQKMLDKTPTKGLTITPTKSLTTTPTKSPSKIESSLGKTVQSNPPSSTNNSSTQPATPNLSQSHKRSLETEIAACSSSKQSSSDNQNKKLKNLPVKGESVATNAPNQPIAQNSQKGYLDRKLFMAIKDSYKYLYRQDQIKVTFRIWELVIDTMYELGFNDIKKDEAKKIYKDWRNKISGSLKRQTPLSEFLAEVNRFMIKVKKHINDLKKDQTINKTVGKKATPPKHKKPYEQDLAYRPSVSDVHPKTNTTIAKEKPQRETSVKTFLQEEMFEENEQLKNSSSNFNSAWSLEENKLYLSVMHEQMPIINTNVFWKNVLTSIESIGLSRTPQAIRYHFESLKKKLGQKLIKNLPLDEIDEIVQELLNKMKNKDVTMQNKDVTMKNKDTETNQIDPKSKNPVTGNVIKEKYIEHTKTDPKTKNPSPVKEKEPSSTMQYITPVASNHEIENSNPQNIEKENEPSSTVQEIAPVESDPEMKNSNHENIEQEKQPLSTILPETNPNTKDSNAEINVIATVDVSYDYVSLEDLRQSTVWDMPPTLQPMVETMEKVNFVVAKVEGGVDFDAPGHSRTVHTEEENSQENKDEDINNQRYVSAKDLEMVIDLVDSDEE